MTAVERSSDGFPLCPRCGARLHRQRRSAVHRVLSVLYPVRAYACTDACGFSAVLPSLSGQQRRKQQVRLLSALAVLALATGIILWKYWGEISWKPEPAPVDAVEEAGG